MTTVINWRVVEGGEGIKFSSSKRELFKNAIETNNVIAETKSNIKKFSKMGLCDESGELTDRGRVVTLRYMSLDRQCKILGIPIEYIPLNRFGESETDALEYYKRNGYKYRISHCRQSSSTGSNNSTNSGITPYRFSILKINHATVLILSQMKMF